MIVPVPRQREVPDVPIRCFQSCDHAIEAIVSRIQEGRKTFCVAANPAKEYFPQSDKPVVSIVHRGTCTSVTAPVPAPPSGS
jgi:hypothetical protein